MEGLNAFATTYFFNFLFFFMRSQFGFTDANNLWLSALNGLFYIPGSWFGGWFAQKFGYFRALRLGFSLLSIALFIGIGLSESWSLCLILTLWTFGVCFTWPTLEALVSEGENRQGLQSMIGTYNMVWAGGSALGYFTGGALLNILGMKSLFWLPIGIHILQIAIVGWLSIRLRRIGLLVPKNTSEDTTDCQTNIPHETDHVIHHSKAFLHMAWIANPFAYVAINTVVALMPGLANRMDLGLAGAGFFCSIWFFARFAAFFILWKWTGWHYRFSWLIGSYWICLLCFLCILLVPQFHIIILAQIIFGLGVGLIYYSSLFYSMDVGDTKGEHGGFHEAAIGSGLFTGPAVGATGLYFLPQYPSSGAWAVAALLTLGLGVIYWVKQVKFTE